MSILQGLLLQPVGAFLGQINRSMRLLVGARTTGYCTGGAGLDVMADCRSLCVCTMPLLSEVPVSGLSAVEIEVVSEPVWDTLSTLIRGGDDGRT